jgi:hypothetical protein
MYLNRDKSTIINENQNSLTFIDLLGTTNSKEEQKCSSFINQITLNEEEIKYDQDS